MNLPKIAAALLAASPAWAAYTYFFADNLASLNTINWSQAGTVTVGNGLAAPDAGGGSLIYRPAVPDGVSPYDYEVRATIALPASGGNYTLFTRADARAVRCTA